MYIYIYIYIYIKGKEDKHNDPKKKYWYIFLLVGQRFIWPVWYIFLKIKNCCLKFFLKLCVGEKVHWNTKNIVQKLKIIVRKHSPNTPLISKNLHCHKIKLHVSNDMD